MINSYSFVNFTNGGPTPGSNNVGYSILKNGTVVYTSAGSTSNQQTCEKLIFINDSVGFSAISYGTWSLQIFKTSNSGQSWNLIKFAPVVNLLDLYPVNENHIYLIAENKNPPMALRIYNCTDDPVTTDTLHYDPYLSNDVSIIDSSITSSLCGTDSINFSVSSTPSNTITYTIYFMITRSNFNPTVGTIYPNPASNEIHIKGDNIVQFEILNSQGAVIRNFSTNSGSLDGLISGLYIIKVFRSDNKIFYNRLLKY